MVDKIGGPQRHLFQPVTLQHEKTTEINNEKAGEKVGQAASRPNRDEMQKVVQGMNDFLKPAGTHLKFEFHDELKEYYVSIVDDVTHEVVKEIPAKKMLDMYAAMTEFLGILVDRKI